MLDHKAIYLAHSKNYGIRYASSSGGFVKSILCYLLDTHQVDYVIITRTGGSESPLTPETIVTRSQGDIISPRTNSIYMVHDPFKGLSLDASKRYAMVCLPCQAGKVKCDFVICLICNHTPLGSFTEEILANLGVSEEEVVDIQYRGKGWPGYFTVFLRDGQEKSVALTEYWNRGHKPFTCQECRCTGGGADILAGDPWRLGLEKTDNLGQTLVACLTDKGHQAVIGAGDYIEAAPIGYEQFKKSQARFLARGEL